MKLLELGFPLVRSWAATALGRHQESEVPVLDGAMAREENKGAGYGLERAIRENWIEFR